MKKNYKKSLIILATNFIFSLISVGTCNAMIGDDDAPCTEAKRTVKAVELWVRSYRTTNFQKTGNVLPLTYKWEVHQNHPCPMTKTDLSEITAPEAQNLIEAILAGKLEIGPKPYIKKK